MTQMRVTIYLLFLVTNVGVSQTLTGGYIFTDPSADIKEGYYFWEDGQFIWFKFLKDKRNYGRGEFQVHNTTITLNFKKARRHFDIASQESKRIGGPNGIVEVGAITSLGAPVSELKVELVKSKIHTSTDSVGYALLDTKQPILKDMIHFELDGYRTIDNSMNLRGYHNLFVVKISNDIEYKEFEESSFKFVPSKTSLLVENLGRAFKFKKVSKKRYLRIYHG